MIRKMATAFIFELEPGERILLLKILRQDPQTPLSRHKITHDVKTKMLVEDQQLLAGGMAANQKTLRQ